MRTSAYECKLLAVHERRTGLVLEVLEVGVSFENLLHVVAHDADHLVMCGLCVVRAGEHENQSLSLKRVGKWFSACTIITFLSACMRMILWHLHLTSSVLSQPPKHYKWCRMAMCSFHHNGMRTVGSYEYGVLSVDTASHE